MRFRSRHASALLVILAVGACGELDPVATYEPITDPSALFMGLTLNHHAINLSTEAPYDELQLVATPRSASGSPISGLPPVDYRSSDTTRLWVSADGLLRARRPGSNLTVIAEIVTSDNIRRADTAFVNVIDGAPPQVETFTLDLVPPAEPLWEIMPTGGVPVGVLLSLSGISVTNTLPLRVLDADGQPVTGLQVRYASLDPVATVNPRFAGVTVVDSGQARITAETFAYGVTLADTITYTVTLPRVNGFQFLMNADSTLTMKPSSVTIRAGGYVGWINTNPAPVAIEFDDPSAASMIPEVCDALGPSHCEDGDVSPFEGSGGFVAGARGRRFDVPGTYTFRTSSGEEGSIVVRAVAAP